MTSEEIQILNLAANLVALFATLVAVYLLFRGYRTQLWIVQEVRALVRLVGGGKEREENVCYQDPDV